MSFDFRETYASWSNEELTKIVANAHRYQADALAAAKELLAERGVVTEDMLQDVDDTMQVAAQYSDSAIQYEDGQTGIFEELGKRLLAADTKKRMAFIAIAWGAVSLHDVFYLFSGYYTAYRFSNDTSLIIVAIAATFISILPYLSVYLLYKRRRSGWLLCTGFLSFYAAAQLPKCLYFVTSGILPVRLNQYISIATLAAYTTSIIFLLSRQFREDFPIARNIMWRPVFAGCVIYLLIYLIIRT